VATRDFAGEGYEADRVSYALELDMKFGGQLNVKRVTSPVLHVSGPDDVLAIREAFETEYSQAYSSLGLNPEAGIEIHNFVLRGRVSQPRPELKRHEDRGTDASAAQTGTRRAYWEEVGAVETPVYTQDLLECGNRLDGPAIVEAEDTTIVVEPGWTFSLDPYMNALIERTAAREPMTATAAATAEA
jgi:N-methylhydantoinase A/oxoprolinase/acetone carboxylase beta subunit